MSQVDITSLKLTGIHLKRLEWIQTTSLCWFCLDELHKAHNKHHIVPRRYFRHKQEAHRNNVVRVCVGCHEQFNNLHDHSHMSVSKYLEYLTDIDYGFGVFVGGD